MAFLAAVLVLAELCDREGLFDVAGHWMVGASSGRPVAPLAWSSWSTTPPARPAGLAGPGPDLTSIPPPPPGVA